MRARTSQYCTRTWTKDQFSIYYYITLGVYLFLKCQLRVLHFYSIGLYRRTKPSSTLVKSKHRNRIIYFLYGLTSGKITPPYLLSQFNFKVPHHKHTRSLAPFYVPACSTNDLSNEPLRRLMLNANTNPDFLYP